MSASCLMLRQHACKLCFLVSDEGPLSSNSGGEVMAFTSTTNETKEKDWPDTQIILPIYKPSNSLMDFFNYAEKVNVLNSPTYLICFMFYCSLLSLLLWPVKSLLLWPVKWQPR